MGDFEENLSNFNKLTTLGLRKQLLYIWLLCQIICATNILTTVPLNYFHSWWLHLTSKEILIFLQSTEWIIDNTLSPVYSFQNTSSSIFEIYLGWASSAAPGYIQDEDSVVLDVMRLKDPMQIKKLWRSQIQHIGKFSFICQMKILLFWMVQQQITLL